MLAHTLFACIVLHLHASIGCTITAALLYLILRMIVLVLPNQSHVHAVSASILLALNFDVHRVGV